MSKKKIINFIVFNFLMVSENETNGQLIVIKSVRATIMLNISDIYHSYVATIGGRGRNGKRGCGRKRKGVEQ